MKKLFIIIGICILLITAVSATIYTEPWIQNQLGDQHNLTDMDRIEANEVNATTFIGEVIGSMNWTKLQNYPAACPGSSAITQLNDSVTCSDLWFNIQGNETITGNMTFNTGSIYNVTSIGIGTDNPLDLLHINSSNEASSQVMIGPGIENVGLAVPGITIGATSGNAAIILGIDGSNYATISWEDLATDYLKIDTNAANRDIYLQSSGGSVEVGGIANITGKLKFNENLTSMNVGNLTGIPEILFNLGEKIQNIVDGWIKIDANTNITGTLTSDSHIIYGSGDVGIVIYQGGTEVGGSILSDGGGGLSFGLGSPDRTIMDFVNDSSLIRLYQNVTMDKNLDVAGNFTGNFYHGEMWNYSTNATSWEFTINTQNVYHNLTGLINGSLYGFTFTEAVQALGGTYLTAEVDGVYQITAAISADGVTGTTDLFGFGIANNFDIEKHRNCYSRRSVRINNVGVIPITCIIPVLVGDTINFQIENEQNTNNLNIHTVNFNINRIGNLP